MKIKYIGAQHFTKGRSLRLFNLILADGRQPTFAVGKGEDIKAKMRACQRRFAKEKAA